MLNKLRLRVRAIISKAKIEDELEDEVRFHLEREIEENIARGMSPEEARFAALRSFGGVERVKEESRDERGVRLRTAADPQNFTARLRSELQAVDQELPLYDVFVMEQVIARKITDQRFYMLLLTTFSALALSLAAAGIYGLISYSVSRRTHEIGIRIALGARAGDVLALIVKEGMKLVLVGLTIGLAGALALTRLLSRFLYQVSVTDPATFALLSLLFIGVALLACYFPARRATRVDPLIAIRSE